MKELKNRENVENFVNHVADYRYDEGLRIRKNSIAPCITANLKSMGNENKDLSNAVYVIEPKIAIKNFKEMVEVRKHVVPIEELQKILRESKDKTKLTMNQISTTLDVPKTKVEHWFRTDSSFSIPDKEVWYKLKNLLEIETSEFDKAITEYVLKESDFDTTNRVYDPNHLSPTINSTSEPKIAVVGNTSRTNHNSHNIYDSNGLAPTISARDYKGPKQVMTEDVRIRKLTPLECWRLQGFSDKQFDKAHQAGLSNSQLYKQAGNAVTVNVVRYIADHLLEEDY